MPKRNAVLMAACGAAVIAVMAFLTLRPTPVPGIQPAQVQKLLRKLGDADPDVRHEGESGFRGLGTAGVAPLREASRSSDHVLAERAARLLQELQPGPGPSPEAPVKSASELTE